MRVATSVDRTIHSLQREAPSKFAHWKMSWVARFRAYVLFRRWRGVALLALACGNWCVRDGVLGARRPQEIGVRMALGASPKAIFLLMLGQALRLVLFSLAAGLVAAATFTRVSGALVAKSSRSIPTPSRQLCSPC